MNDAEPPDVGAAIIAAVTVAAERIQAAWRALRQREKAWSSEHGGGFESLGWVGHSRRDRAWIHDMWKTHGRINSSMRLSTGTPHPATVKEEAGREGAVERRG